MTPEEHRDQHPEWAENSNEHECSKCAHGIRHQNGYVTYYAHCSKLLVSYGTKVYQGQAIAKVGSTGRSTGPHLHFEIRKGGKTVNPLNYLP